MKERVVTAGMFQDGGFWVVNEHFGWNTAEEIRKRFGERPGSVRFSPRR
jgi:hypothetical protein